MIGKLKRQLILGASFVEDVPLAYGLDDLAEMRFKACQVHGPLAPNQTYVALRVSSLPDNDPYRMQVSRELPENGMHDQKEPAILNPASTSMENLRRTLVTMNNKYHGLKSFLADSPEHCHVFEIVQKD